HSRVPVGDFKIGRIARSRKAHLSNSVPTDLEVSDKDWARREGMQSFAGYPLLVEDRLVGVVAMFARHRLSEYQIEALASVSRMIATTVGRKLIEIQLQQNEAELQDFFDNSLVGIQWIAADGIILKANKAALEMLDYREDEYVGRNIVDFHIYKLVLSNILKELGRGVSIRGRQLRLRHKDGSIREVLLDSNALIKDGQFVHARCITRDITEQSYFQKLTRVENEVTNILARSASAEHAIKFIIQYICNQFKWQVGIFWQQNSKEDLQASFVWSSTSDYSSYQIVSTTRRFLINNTVVGRTFRTKEHVWLGDITKDPGYSRAEEAAKNNIKSVLTLPIVLDNKPYGVLEFAGNAISEPDTDLLRILKSVANQIGQYIERMRSAAGLKEQWNLLNNILDNVANGVVASDKNGKMLLFNAHAELILGRGQSESDWREWTREYQLFMDDGVTPYPVDELPLVRAMNGQSVDGIELVVGRDESSKWILVSGRPLIGATGDCYGGVIVFHDITERKENEKRISEFYSMVSHELRTPLTSIRGSLGLLEGRFSADIPPKGAKLVEIARLECDRLVR
ncbi:MAG: GAF domain-containing protein, partial [Candidatus Obscuribacterales bacterium]|nr:GAF domain-containing protein [Candidatus Obscuribacterales bacterium]